MTTTISTLLLIVQLIFVVLTINKYYTIATKDRKWYEEQLRNFTEDQTENEIPKMIKEAVKEKNKKLDARIDLIHTRATLLAKENDKLRAENEIMKSKLNNLGFTDISIDM